MAHKTTALPLSYGSFASGGVRTREAFAGDLKSPPFDHSGTLAKAKVPLAGLEPATPGLEVQCAIHCATRVLPHGSCRINSVLMFNDVELNEQQELLMSLCLWWICAMMWLCYSGLHRF